MSNNFLNTKARRPYLFNSLPPIDEGVDGDFAISVTQKGASLYVKFNNKWFRISALEDVASLGDGSSLYKEEKEYKSIKLGRTKIQSSDSKFNKNVIIDNGTGIVLKDDSGKLSVRNKADNADAEINAKYLKVSGENTGIENTLAISSSFGAVFRANGLAIDGYSIPASNASFTQVCATNSSSSSIDCSSANTNIKVGQIVSGTGIPTGKVCYVGAITEDGGAGTGVTSFTLHQDGVAVNASATNDPVTLSFRVSEESKLRILSNRHHAYVTFNTSSVQNPWGVGINIREATHNDDPTDAPFVISQGVTADALHTNQRFSIDSDGNAKFHRSAGFDIKTITYGDVVDGASADTGNNTDVDFRKSNKAKLILTGGQTVAILGFVFPPNSGNFTLLLSQDGSGTGVVTAYKAYESDTSDASGSTTLLWPNGTNPTLTTTANKLDIISIFWDQDAQKAYAAITQTFG